MIAVFIHGPAAAGKDAIGSHLSERIGLPFFTTILRCISYERSLSSARKTRTSARLHLAEDLLAERTADRSFLFIFDPKDSIAPETVTKSLAIIRNSGDRVAFVELQSPLKSASNISHHHRNNPTSRQWSNLLDSHQSRPSPLPWPSPTHHRIFHQPPRSGRSPNH